MIETKIEISFNLKKKINNNKLYCHVNLLKLICDKNNYIIL